MIPNPLWPIRIRVKLLLARVVTIIELCKDCGVEQPLVWHADDALWDEISSGKGVLCPACFDRRAHALGILLMWTPTVDARRDASGKFP